MINTGYKKFKQRRRLINGVADGFVEPNSISEGQGPYFPPIKDLSLCPIPTTTSTTTIQSTTTTTSTTINNSTTTTTTKDILSFYLFQYRRRLKLTGTVPINCNIVLSIIYKTIQLNTEFPGEVNIEGPFTTEITLLAGDYQGFSVDLFTGPIDLNKTIVVESFGQVPLICEGHSIEINNETE